MSTLTDEILRRRTFAIISHPDAGKTTLTEKLLLFGGAIQLAGEVKARGERRRVRSDWMAVERERGISISSAVMSFEHEGLAFNLLDTPGHQAPERGRQRGDGPRRRGGDPHFTSDLRTTITCLTKHPHLENTITRRYARSGDGWKERAYGSGLNRASGPARRYR